MTSAQQTPGWWSRNWKWIVPGGCLTALVLVGGFVALIIFGVFGMMKRTDAYKEAFAKASTDSRVEAVLGTPVKAGSFVTGNVQINGASGSASLAIPLSGPRGAATLFVEARKSAGTWKFSELVVALKNSTTRIDLLESADGSPPDSNRAETTAPPVEK